MTRDIGLSLTELNEIKDILGSCSDVTTAYLFGSRAKGNYRKGSDVDIALEGEQLSRSEMTSLSYLLNQETLLPYHFDLLQLESTDPEVCEHIQRVGIKIYP